MAILGTVSQTLMDYLRNTKYFIRINGNVAKLNSPYSTGDIIAVQCGGRFSDVTIIGGYGTPLTITDSSKVFEFLLDGTTPFTLEITATQIGYTGEYELLAFPSTITYTNENNIKLYSNGVRYYSVIPHSYNSNFKIMADDGYKIESAKLDGVDFNVIEPNKIYDTNFNVNGVFINKVVVDVVVDDAPPPDPDMLVTQADLDSFTSQKGQLRSGSTILNVGDKYVQGSTITYFTNEPYYIVDSVKFLDGGKEFNRIQTTNNFVTTYPHEYSDQGLLIDVVGHYQEFFVDQTEIDDINAQNSKLYVNGVLATNTTKLNVGDEIEVIANDGYKYFMNDGYSSVYSSNANTWLDLTDDETTAKFTINRIDYPLGFEIETVVIKPDVIKGVNNVYKLTYEQTKQIIRMDLIDDTIPLDPKPLGHLLLGLLELPFTIPSDMIIGKQNVNLGGYPIDINADVLADDKLIIDFGNIIVPNVKNNLLDFKNATTVLNMPYVEKMFLETGDVIGHIINVQMVINLYDSMTTVNVSSSKNDKIILSKSVDLKLSIPFGDVPSYPKGSNPHDVSLAKDNGVKTAFIEVIQNDVLNENGLFTIPVIDENLLYSQNGYIEIEKIDLKSNASKNEKDEIINLLNRGVIIK